MRNITNKKYNQLASKILAQKISAIQLNLGYWENTSNVVEACNNLILRFAKFAEISEHQSILDVGFGYGEQILILSKLYKHLTIDGIDLSQIHLEVASKKIKQHKLSNRVNLIKGDINNKTLLPNKYDRIIAIESAFHFNREKFFQKSFKSLKIGGIIALADIIFSTDAQLSQETFKKLGVHKSNVYTIAQYTKLLATTGFTEVEYINISDYTIPFAAIESAQLNGWRSSKTISTPPDKAQIDAMSQAFKKSTAIDQYFLIKAKKLKSHL